MVLKVYHICSHAGNNKETGKAKKKARNNPGLSVQMEELSVNL